MTLSKIYPCEGKLSEINESLEKSLRAFPLTAVPGARLSRKDCTHQPYLIRLWKTLMKGRDVGNYRTVSIREVDETLRLINQIAEVGTTPETLFLVHTLLGYILPYRYLPEGLTLSMPVWYKGSWQLKTCRHVETVRLLGGFLARIWIPDDKKGSPTCLFHGTVIIMAASGAAISLADDLNPLGVGYFLQSSAKVKLKVPLAKWNAVCGEKSVCIGQSLGGTLSVGLALDLPKFISHAFAFSPPRPNLFMERKWDKMEGDKPKLFTFIPSYCGKGDWITLLGDRWIGDVYSVNHKKDIKLMARHILPIARSQTVDLDPVSIEQVNGGFWRQTHLFTAVQRSVGFLIGLIAWPLIALFHLINSER